MSLCSMYCLIEKLRETCCAFWFFCVNVSWEAITFLNHGKCLLVFFSRNIRDFVSKHKDQIKFFNTIHSYSQLVLLPWGDTTDNAPGYDKLKNLADKSNEALYAVHGTRFDVGCIPCLLYIASGGSMDWVSS